MEGRNSEAQNRRQSELSSLSLLQQPLLQAQRKSQKGFPWLSGSLGDGDLSPVRRSARPWGHGRGPGRTEGRKKRTRRMSCLAMRQNSNVGAERGPCGQAVDPQLSRPLNHFGNGVIGREVTQSRGKTLGLWRQEKNVDLSSDPPVIERS